MSSDDTPAAGPSAPEPRATRRSLLAAAGVVATGGFLSVGADAADAADARSFLSTGDTAMTDDSTAGDAAQEAAASGPDWPQGGASAGHDSFLPDGVAPTATPTERWRYSNDRYHDGCAVVGDTVVVGGKGLAAVDLATGAERWSYAPDPPPEHESEDGTIPEAGTPAVADGVVYAGLGWGPYDGGSPDAVLVAVDATAGTKQWRFDPAGFTAYATPTVADGTVFTTGTRESDGQTVVFALRADGTVAWQRAVGDAGRRTPVAVAEGTVYANAAAGVVALDAATGAEQWTALPEVDLTVPPVVGGGRLYVGEAAEPGVTVVALDAATGAEQWRTAYAPEYEALSVEAVDADRVYIQMRYSDADVVALDAATGDEAWRTTLEYDPPPDYYTDGVARVGDLLYAGSVCLDPADGAVVWQHGLETTASGWWLGAAARGVCVLLGTDVVVLEGPDGGTPTDTTDPGTETTTDTTNTTDPGTETTTDSTDPGTTDPGTTDGGGTTSGGDGTTTVSEGGECEI